MKKLLFSITPESQLFHDLTMTALRVFTGLSMALAHGIGKIPPSEKFLEGVRELGFPLPEFFAWSAGLAEFVGGLFLAFGLLTRPSALMIAFTMAVAALGRHAADPFKMKEMAFLYLMVTLVFAVRGANRFSIDALFSKKK